MRSNAGLYVKRLRAQLVDHIGHPPSKVEAIYIERCCWLSLRLAFLDQKIADDQDFNLPDANYYLAWSNSLCRTLARLGIQQGKPKANGKVAHLNVMREIGHADAAD
jgi:hypothetical protein